MTREVREPKTIEGNELHPAFGLAYVNRVTSSPGAVLFDSEIRHQHYVVFTVERATRSRDLSRDWIHPDGKPLLEIAMSEAQWGALISSFGNGSGSPVTITRTENEVRVPGIPYAPRMAHSTAEVRGAAEKAFEKVKEALAVVEERPNKGNLQKLRWAVEGAGPNVEYAAESLTQHVENVVTKARADVEAMVTARAAQLGIEAPQVAALEAGQDLL